MWAGGSGRGCRPNWGGVGTQNVLGVSSTHNNVYPTYQVPTMQLWVSFDNSFIGSLNGPCGNKGLHKAAKSEPWGLPKNHLREPCSCFISTVNCLNLLSKPEPDLFRVLIISMEKNCYLANKILCILLGWILG